MCEITESESLERRLESLQAEVDRLKTGDVLESLAAEVRRLRAEDARLRTRAEWAERLTRKLAGILATYCGIPAEALIAANREGMDAALAGEERGGS